MKYEANFIEAKWQQYWKENQTFKATNPPENSGKPKYYVLDMFPYPSGAGLHVGHPLGYIASDIVARYKRHQGFEVLHPMGYDSFGLPAEQYAIQTGQHPEKTTKANIARYREQLDKIGFSFDWSREIRTSNPNYYRWTQWIFIQLFESWYNLATDKAENIETLVKEFQENGNTKVQAVCDEDVEPFTAEEWHSFSDEKQQKILLQYRLTYLAETEVNWCPALGTVLANDEIINGVSERGGHLVIRKKMTQWSMRITAYSERLLQGLDTIDWSESIKESQRNWIGKSVGAEVVFNILPHPKLLSEGEELKAKFPYETADPIHAKTLVEHARNNRKEKTESEDIIWQQVRNQQLGYKIRRQHYIGNYIVDFVCLEKKLIIEIDGEYHDYEEQIELDKQRTLELEQKYLFKVIRFTNDEVKNDLFNVLQKIKLNLEQLNPETPLSFGEGPGVRSENSSLQKEIRVFTTRPDTIFGVTFLTLAPEHELVAQITTQEQKEAVEAYIEATSKRSERERMADVKTISGVFTGAYAQHPLSNEPIPIWIGDYVLAGYGTGAVMAVPCGDERDYAFANFFRGAKGMPDIKNIFNQDISKAAFTSKDGFELINSDFLNGLGYKEATKKVIETLENLEAGKAKINYRLRDAVFSRQRYWGEPIPMYYKNEVPYPIPTQCLPLELPEVEKYLPTEDGQPPLGNAIAWAWDTEKNKVVHNDCIDQIKVFPLELNTMPGWAGSSWYWMRYMDATNEQEFVGKEALNFWESVDLYIGGSEHATGHLLYARFWNKFLKDKGLANTEEPFQKLINQGMILGMSAFVYRTEDSKKIISKGQISNYKTQPIHVDLSCINDITNELDIEKFRNHPLYADYKDATFICENGEVLSSGEDLGELKFLVGREVEKMSKSKYNVVNPDDICNEYGADTLRLYEMFLGPLEQAKPWNTAGITGVYGFLKKLWRLYFDDNGLNITNEEPTAEMYKSLHKTIKKVTDDIENFSFNTSVSQFMICVNELSQQKCRHRAILEPLAILISPYAPHIAEELWEKLGHSTSITFAPFPKFEEKYLIESTKEYPVSFNGKMRFTLHLPLNLTAAQIEAIVMQDERTQNYLQGNAPKKTIIVPGKIINIVM
jgi:leucyl-tRNA synthetase